MHNSGTNLELMIHFSDPIMHKIGTIQARNKHNTSTIQAQYKHETCF